MHTRACDEILYFFDTCANFMLPFFLYFKAYKNCEKLLKKLIKSIRDFIFV